MQRFQHPTFPPDPVDQHDDCVDVMWVALLVLQVVYLLVMRSPRHRVYAGLEPGSVPERHAPTRLSWWLGWRLSAPVRDAPPPGVSVADLAYLVHGRRTNGQVLAMLLDLALQGHLSIEVVDTGWRRRDWLVRRRQGDADHGSLSQAERSLVTRLNEQPRSVRELIAAGARGPVGEDVALARGWIKHDSWQPPVVVGALDGLVLTALAWPVIGPLALVILSVTAVIPFAWRRHSFTAQGSALRAQAWGFRRFLESCPPEYFMAHPTGLSQALALGLGKRWIRQLAAHGMVRGFEGALVADSLEAVGESWASLGGGSAVGDAAVDDD